MFDDLDDSRADRALHDGLRDLPAPETSADFESRILTALMPQPTWWQTAWSAVRPAIPTALYGLIVMLLLLHYAQQTPNGGPNSVAIARDSVQTPQIQACDGDSQEPTLEWIDNIDLDSTALSFLSHPITHIPGKCG